MGDLRQGASGHRLKSVPGDYWPPALSLTLLALTVVALGGMLGGALSWLVWGAVAVALAWLWPFGPWVEIGADSLIAHIGSHRWEIGRLDRLEAAVSIDNSRLRPPFNRCVQLMLGTKTGNRLRSRELRFADEEAFLAALAASDPGLEHSPGRVVRVPASALEKADG